MAWTTIASGSLAVGKPLTSTIAIALRDNPGAIAEASSAAPVLQQAWHPYDKVTNGDANTGLIYDAAVTGAVATLESPDLEDGYEYQVIMWHLSHSSGAAATARVDLYRETTAAWTAATGDLITIVSVAAGARFTARVDLPAVRTSEIDQPFTIHGGAAATVPSGTLYMTTAQKALKARVSFSAGNISAGKIFLFRRTVFGVS